MPNPGKELADAQLEAKVMELRLQAMSYNQIANQLKTTASRVADIVKGSLKELKAYSLETTAEHVDIELMRLDALQSALWPQAMRGNAQAIGRVLDIMARRSRYLGLDMPTKIAPTDPSGQNPWEGMSDADIVAALIEAAGRVIEPERPSGVLPSDRDNTVQMDFTS